MVPLMDSEPGEIPEAISGAPSSDRTPVFKRCVRCRYSLRGLPSNHACPECGLRFDEQCELFRVRNPRQVLATWGLIFFGGFIGLRRLVGLSRWSTLSLFDKIYTGSAVVFLVVLIVFIGFAFRKFRRGLEVAITGDGLFLHLMGMDDGLISWSEIAGAAVRANLKDKPNARVVEVTVMAGRKKIVVGGVQHVFSGQADAERFVKKISERIGVIPEGENAVADARSK